MLSLIDLRRARDLARTPVVGPSLGHSFSSNGCFEDDPAILIDSEAQDRPNEQNQFASCYLGEMWGRSWNRCWDM